MHPDILASFQDELEKIAAALPFNRAPWAPAMSEVGIKQQHGPFAVRRKKLPTPGAVPQGRVRNVTRAMKVKPTKGLLRSGVSLGVRAATRGKVRI